MNEKISCSCNDEHTSGCMICGEELMYTDEYMDNTLIHAQCAYCKKEEDTRVICCKGHYVCDECHRKEILDFVEQICGQSDLTDPVELAEQIFQLPGLHMHGPEYHSIVPAILMTAYDNKIMRDKKTDIAEAIKRGKDIKGGVCGSHGACGAAIGIGIAYSIIHRVTPFSQEERGTANRMTALALLEISRFGGPRCCKRDAMLAIETALKHMGCFTAMDDRRYICRQFMNNKGCIGVVCPYFPS